MSLGGRAEEEAARRTQEVTERAIRRLDVLEWVILAGAVLAAAVGGWLVASLLATVVEFPFRVVWVVSSLLLFGVPGTVALLRKRREDREWRAKLNQSEENDG